MTGTALALPACPDDLSSLFDDDVVGFAFARQAVTIELEGGRSPAQLPSSAPRPTPANWPPPGPGVAPTPAAPRHAAGSAGSTHPVVRRSRLAPYHGLMLAVVATNAAVLIDHLWRGDWRIVDGSAADAMSALTLVNLAGAVLVRQQAVLNLLYGLAGRGSRWWPLWVRWSISKVHHVGGIHAGCAMAGTAWLGAFSVTTFIAAVRYPGSVTPATQVLCAALAAVLLTVVVGALPVVRMRAHNVFEHTHRWGGWTAVVLFWVLIVHLTAHRIGDEPLAAALASDWQAWVLAIVTMSVAWPWLRLRRVPITVERPSAHAAIVHLDYGVTPKFSAGVGISRSPLREWHAFATVTSPGRSGYRLLISRAGDWTGRFIDDPPTHVWVRGVPVSAPMAKVSVLYERVVYVVTGSGIGPCLGQILADRVPARLVWSTRDPRRTYGDALVDEVLTAQSEAVIWDTTHQGKPDLLQLALDACTDFDAEAVFIVSNKATTLRLVHDLERRGIPAFGPIWDS